MVPYTTEKEPSRVFYVGVELQETTVGVGWRRRCDPTRYPEPESVTASAPSDPELFRRTH